MEIKFKWKTLVNNKTVYWYYYAEHHYWDPTTHIIRHTSWNLYIVDWETTSQYIWLKDKNGVEVYYWDVIKFKIWVDEIEGVISRNKYQQSCIIADWRELHIDNLWNWEITER